MLRAPHSYLCSFLVDGTQQILFLFSISCFPILLTLFVFGPVVRGTAAGSILIFARIMSYMIKPMVSGGVFFLFWIFRFFGVLCFSVPPTRMEFHCFLRFLAGVSHRCRAGVAQVSRRCRVSRRGVAQVSRRCRVSRNGVAQVSRRCRAGVALVRRSIGPVGAVESTRNA